MDLLSMIEAGGKMKIEVSSDDLVLFADRLIEKAMEANHRRPASVYKDPAS